MKLAQLRGGSGILTYRGLSLESKDGIKYAAKLDTFDIPIDGIDDAADKRVTTQGIKVMVTPSGEYTNPDRLYPYLSMPSGRYLVPVLPASINTGTDVVTSKRHGFYTGDRVQIDARPGGTFPTAAGVTNETYLYVRKITDDTYSLHDTAAHAAADSDKTPFSAAGTDVVVIGQFELVLYTEQGKKITFHSVAITKQPDLDLSREKTPFGEVEFTVFRRNGFDDDDDNAFYTIEDEDFPGWSANASDIKTQAQTVA